ncbi:hypothetical protein [Algoriphagus persicinus]|uniref:hypothetical protein n=1 Tax=Algoriphagus persicinus TaxID=3108754 RepID=UPI002B3BDE15|nr:hypothetical protein [Algoriphagus sp. E1-3-M2]MEB2785309.1 hypothetical protein [Algoriphagus sp. E1-3-M2]
MSLENEELVTTEDMRLYLQFDILRSGDQSSFGDFVLTHQNVDGKLTQVGLVRGVAVYTPVEKRRYSIPLDIQEGHILNSGTLLLEYVGQKRGWQVLASLEIPLVQISSNKNNDNKAL